MPKLATWGRKYLHPVRGGLTLAWRRKDHLLWAVVGNSEYEDETSRPCDLPLSRTESAAEEGRRKPDCLTSGIMHLRISRQYRCAQAASYAREQAIEQRAYYMHDVDECRSC
jgi:hypothetical protein